MHAAIFVPIFAAAALAQSGSSSIDPFPQTSFLQQTNSLGVVTGQPPVATSIPSAAVPNVSQPPAVTTQPPAASIPALGTGIHTIIQGIPGTNQTTTLVVSINNSTHSIVTPATSSAGSGSGSGAVTTGTGRATGSGASGSAATGTNQPGAAATMKAMAGGLVGAGALMAAFL
ncbi:hypothetical protein B0J11DRAFT_613371 [Dendryphion nanum]|uniref:Uncharacterized protein n=1 Tax=Dendryphion nanum TaxID=256645 RepID=A0A9P9E3L0_9PLEO|nr:hypothetical protein B0J11DRAFT_613371 [Dendryphion nanum]